MDMTFKTMQAPSQTGLKIIKAFWIGLDILYKLTAGTYNTLRIEYVTIDNKHEIIDYKGFQIVQKQDYWTTYEEEITVKGDADFALSFAYK